MSLRSIPGLAALISAFVTAAVTSCRDGNGRHGLARVQIRAVTTQGSTADMAWLVGRIHVGDTAAADGWKVVVLTEAADVIIGSTLTKGGGGDRAGTYRVGPLPVGIPVRVVLYQSTAADPLYAKDRFPRILTFPGPRLLNIRVDTLTGGPTLPDPNGLRFVVAPSWWTNEPPFARAWGQSYGARMHTLYKNGNLGMLQEVRSLNEEMQLSYRSELDKRTRAADYEAALLFLEAHSDTINATTAAWGHQPLVAATSERMMLVDSLQADENPNVFYEGGRLPGKVWVHLGHVLRGQVFGGQIVVGVWGWRPGAEGECGILSRVRVARKSLLREYLVLDSRADLNGIDFVQIQGTSLLRMYGASCAGANTIAPWTEFYYLAPDGQLQSVPIDENVENLIPGGLPPGAMLRYCATGVKDGKVSGGCTVQLQMDPWCCPTGGSVLWDYTLAPDSLHGGQLRLVPSNVRRAAQ